MRKMSCDEAVSLVTPFINDELDDETAAGFLEHVMHCPDCYDELETYFIVDYSLRFLDNDNDASYDLKRLLKDKISKKERELSRRRWMQILFPLATAALIVLILLILVRENSPELFTRILDRYETFLNTVRSMK